ncbi:ODF3A protein, partial [Pelecanoides urinatrix]|nr:ODF3A protein [Pelecanoides urinatrix]
MSANAWVGSWRPHRPRGPIAALYTSPGPKYGLPTNVGYRLHDPCRGRAPAYSFGLRAGGRQDERSPGPAYLVPPKTTTKGKDGIPAYTMCGRPHDLPLVRTPGPGEGGAGSPGGAAGLGTPSRAPGPAPRSPQAATPRRGPAGWPSPARPPAPSVSATGRTPATRRRTPGPCGYRMVDTDIFKRRAPQYSMVARNVLPGDTTTKPGPGTYNPEQVRGRRGSRWQGRGAGGGGPPVLTGTLSPAQQGRQRGLTFGIRHSEYLAPLIVDVP